MSFNRDMAIPVPMHFDGHNINVITKLTNQSVPQPRDHQSLYKTELCREWTQSGWCYYGKRCSFSHGLQELRPVFRSKKWRTKRCRTWDMQGFCPYEHRCQFLHDQSPHQPNDADDSNPNVPLDMNNQPQYDGENAIVVVRDMSINDVNRGSNIRSPKDMNVVQNSSLPLHYKVEHSIQKAQKSEREIHMSSDKEDTENSGSLRKLRDNDSYENSSTSQSIYNEKSSETTRQDSIVADVTRTESLSMVEEQTLSKNPIYASLPNKVPICTLSRLKIDQQSEKKHSRSQLNDKVKILPTMWSAIDFSIVTDDHVNTETSNKTNTNKGSPYAKNNFHHTKMEANEATLTTSMNIKKLDQQVMEMTVSGNGANDNNVGAQASTSMSEQKFDPTNANSSLELSLNSSMESSTGMQNFESMNSEGPATTPSAQLPFGMPNLNFLSGNWDISSLDAQNGLDFNAMASNYLSSLTPAQLEFVSGQLLEVAQSSKNVNDNEPNSSGNGNGNEKLNVRNLFSISNLGTKSITPVGLPNFGDLEFPLPTPSPPPSMLNPTSTPVNGDTFAKQLIHQIITPAPLSEQDISNSLTPTTLNLFNSINAVLNSQSNLHNSVPMTTQAQMRPQTPVLLTSTEATINPSSNPTQPIAVAPSIGLTIASSADLMNNKLWFNNYDSNHETTNGPSSLDNFFNTDYSALVEYLNSTDVNRALSTIHFNSGNIDNNKNDSLIGLPPLLSQTPGLPSAIDITTTTTPSTVFNTDADATFAGNSTNTNTIAPILNTNSANCTSLSTTIVTSTINDNQESLSRK